MSWAPRPDLRPGRGSCFEEAFTHRSWSIPQSQETPPSGRWQSGVITLKISVHQQTPEREWRGSRGYLHRTSAPLWDPTPRSLVLGPWTGSNSSGMAWGPGGAPTTARRGHTGGTQKLRCAQASPAHVPNGVGVRGVEGAGAPAQPAPFLLGPCPEGPLSRCFLGSDRTTEAQGRWGPPPPGPSRPRVLILCPRPLEASASPSAECGMGWAHQMALAPPSPTCLSGEIIPSRMTHRRPGSFAALSQPTALAALTRRQG